MEPSSPIGILTFQTGGQAMSQIDPWEKAAECARAVENNLDPHRKAQLTVLQHMWLALAAERGCLSPWSSRRRSRRSLVFTPSWPRAAELPIEPAD
jgi:hypothetical protein